MIFQTKLALFEDIGHREFQWMSYDPIFTWPFERYTTFSDEAKYHISIIYIYIYLVSFIPWIHEYPIQIIHIIPNVLVMDYAWIILLE